MDAKEVVRQTYDYTNVELADQWAAEIVRDFADESMPFEVRRLGGTIAKWAGQITGWHRSQVSNGPTETVNNWRNGSSGYPLGITNWTNYRTCSLLDAGRPDWTLLPTIQP